MSAADIGFVEVDGLRLRERPARDACFTVVRHDAEMATYAGSDATAVREMVHRHMSNEITSLDIAAQCLAEFPEAPWALRLELARQCWDEARHVQALARRLDELGGRKGEFPVSTFEWDVTCAIADLPGRLATQNRTFEAGAMDVVGGLVRGVREAGDERTAEVLDAILADEIQHVRFANRWIKTFVEQDRRTLLKVATAVRFVEHVNRRLQAPPGLEGPAADPRTAQAPAVNIEDRRLAEFSNEEIQEILRQAGFRSLLDEPAEART
jgi:uncharacterized ferritin-like protein (DUF455 family)